MGRELYKLNVRWLKQADLLDVVEIERETFVDDWSASEIKLVLRQKCTVAMVACYGELNLGYMIYELHRDRISLIRLAVHPGFLRVGVGTRLVKTLLGSNKARRVEIAVCESNFVAQVFFRSLGFEVTQIYRDYYEGEDAYLFRVGESVEEVLVNRLAVE